MLRGTIKLLAQIFEIMGENSGQYCDQTCDPYHVKVEGAYHAQPFSNTYDDFRGRLSMNKNRTYP